VIRIKAAFAIEPGVVVPTQDAFETIPSGEAEVAPIGIKDDPDSHAPRTRFAHF
jgi:hypothetical protein